VDTVIASTKALYDDRNLLLRSRLAENSIRFLSPILTAYIKQGVDEGLFFPSDPDHIGEVMLRLKVAIGERVMPMFFEIKDHPEHAEEISIGFSLYQDSVERLLGVKPGTLNIFDPAEFKEKFGSR